MSAASRLLLAEEAVESYRFSAKISVLPKISVFAENFGFIRFTVHGRYLLPGTRHLAEIFGFAENFGFDEVPDASGTFYSRIMY